MLPDLGRVGEEPRWSMEGQMGAMHSSRALLIASRWAKPQEIVSQRRVHFAQVSRCSHDVSSREPVKWKHMQLIDCCALASCHVKSDPRCVFLGSFGPSHSLAGSIRGRAILCERRRLDFHNPVTDATLKLGSHCCPAWRRPSFLPLSCKQNIRPASFHNPPHIHKLFPF